jgi:hypothetical protein
LGEEGGGGGGGGRGGGGGLTTNVLFTTQSQVVVTTIPVHEQPLYKKITNFSEKLIYIYPCILHHTVAYSLRERERSRIFRRRFFSLVFRENFNENSKCTVNNFSQNKNMKFGLHGKISSK